MKGSVALLMLEDSGWKISRNTMWDDKSRFVDWREMMSGKANETISLFISKLSEATGYKYLKSNRSLKKTIGQMVFEVLFFSSK